MLGRWLREFARGYIVFTVTGDNVAAFLNYAVEDRFEIWDVRQLAPGKFVATTTLSDYRRIRPVLRKAGCRVHLRKKAGIPFWKGLAKRRPLFIGGFVLFVGLLLTSTKVVWSVQVEGNDNVSSAEILAAATQVGIHPGAFSPNLPDTDVLQSQLLDKLPRLSWVGVRIQGTTVHIQVVEKIPGTAHAVLGPRNIVAGSKGVVDQIFVRKGTGAVGRGAYVEPGQILISGTVGDQTVAAEGTVLAHVWYTSDVELPLQFTQQALTGEKVHRMYLMLGDWPLLIWGYQQIPFAVSQLETRDEQFEAAGLQLPIRIRQADYYEVKHEEIVKSKQEALTKAMEIAKHDVLTSLRKGGEVQRQKVLKEELKNGKLYVRVWTDVVEDIGIPQPINPAPRSTTPTPQSPDQ